MHNPWNKWELVAYKMFDNNSHPRNGFLEYFVRQTWVLVNYNPLNGLDISGKQPTCVGLVANPILG
jgi:hypothetical protein